MALFLGTIVGATMPQVPESPCPHVFQYHTSTVPGDTAVAVTGLITVARPPLETVLYLLVNLQLQAVLPSKYVGLVELLDTSRNQTLYRVRFPLVKPLPTVRLISINGQTICTGPPVTGPVVTDIRLEHSLSPLNQTVMEPMEPTQPTQPTHPTHRPPQDQANPYNIDPGGECGRAMMANPLVMGGYALRRGQWPWLVAIFILTQLGLEFHCSGTIITPIFIVTVGHCLHHDEAGTMMPSEVVAYLGKFSLHQWVEPHSVMKEVAEIFIHPEFDPSSYQSDVALLKLKTPVQFNMFIQPACLWNQPDLLSLIVGRNATVVGWGKDHLGNKMSPVPRVLGIPIVSTEECVDSHKEFFFITSATTLCAGTKNGVGPCNGDSGAGLMLPVTDPADGRPRWRLRGLVSLSLLNQTTQSCDLSQYVVFTDTAKFLPWIASVINSHKSTVLDNK